MTELQVQSRSEELFGAHRNAIFKRTDRIFAWLLIAEWVAGIVVALALSPQTWAGQTSRVHAHVWAAVFLGAAMAAFPVYLCFVRPAAPLTRHVVALAQMLFSALFIHLTGGRLETHFHVFGSLAFLAFYRDWRVLLTASAVVYVDHFVRGLYWPMSVYGVSTPAPWRAIEHAWWVVFEVAFLVVAMKQSVREMWAMAERQARLEQTNAKIEDTVKERTRQLKEVNTQMENFCYSMAHDLRAPLRSMQGFSQMLVEEHCINLDSKGQEFARRIAGSAAQMDLLLRDLLDYSRIASADLELGRVELDGLLRKVLELLGNEIKKREAVVKVEFPLLPVLGHEATICQVALNLISNAIKFVDAGVQPQVRVWTSAHGSGVRLWVQDNGIGIESQQQRKLFKMFERLQRDFEGTGMGLALVHKAVERMGGKVGLESELAKGSCFWVELPAGDSLAPSRRFSTLEAKVE